MKILKFAVYHFFIIPAFGNLRRKKTDTLLAQFLSWIQFTWPLECCSNFGSITIPGTFYNLLEQFFLKNFKNTTVQLKMSKMHLNVKFPIDCELLIAILEISQIWISDGNWQILKFPYQFYRFSIARQNAKNVVISRGHPNFLSVGRRQIPA